MALSPVVGGAALSVAALPSELAGGPALCPADSKTGSPERRGQQPLSCPPDPGQYLGALVWGPRLWEPERNPGSVCAQQPRGRTGQVPVRVRSRKTAQSQWGGQVACPPSSEWALNCPMPHQGLAWVVSLLSSCYGWLRKGVLLPGRAGLDCGAAMGRSLATPIAPWSTWTG